MDILSDKIVTTRKKHMCSACGRKFEAGTRMRAQVNTYDGIHTWRACLACDVLLTKYRKLFVSNNENICEIYCVSDSLEKNETPEGLLNKLNVEHDGKANC